METSSYTWARGGLEPETYSVIPDRDIIQFPLEPDLKVVVLAYLGE